MYVFLINIPVYEKSFLMVILETGDCVFNSVEIKNGRDKMFDGYRIDCENGNLSVDNDTLAFVGQ